MEKNEFDDIILEKSNKNEKIKKILLRVIALIILFLVVMIVMKLINGSDDSAQNDILPPEPLNTQAQNSNNNGFENVPITQNESPEDQFEALRRQIEGETNSQTNIAQNNASTQDNTNFTAPREEIPAQPEPEQIPQQTPPPAPKAAEPASPKPQAQPSKPKEQPKQTPKEQPKNADTKELFKKVEAKESPKDGLVPGLYVQIFSVNNLDQKSKELAEVKKKGYDYKLYKTSVNGKEMTKVLIGPFDKNTIASELEKIRKEVAKEAFSFTLK